MRKPLAAALVKREPEPSHAPRLASVVEAGVGHK